MLNVEFELSSILLFLIVLRVGKMCDCIIFWYILGIFTFYETRESLSILLKFFLYKHPCSMTKHQFPQIKYANFCTNICSQVVYNADNLFLNMSDHCLIMDYFLCYEGHPIKNETFSIAQ